MLNDIFSNYSTINLSDYVDISHIYSIQHSIQLKNYACIEIGTSAYTEFKMSSGKFETTEHGIFLGTVIAKDESEALELLENSPEHKGREFDNVILFELAKH